MDEEIEIPLDQIRGRHQPSMSDSTSSPNISMSEAGTSTSYEPGDFIVCSLKLFAVSDTRQKLIGVVNFVVDYKSPKYKAKNRQSIPFSKCIDNSACVVVSTRLQDQKNSNNTAAPQKRLMIPRPIGRKANTFEEECNIFENF